MQLRNAVSPELYKRMSTSELRETFLADGLFAAGAMNFLYWETDRTVVGAAVPLAQPLTLGCDAVLASDFFCQRRELGILNLGGIGTVTADGAVQALETKDCLYVGRGVKEVVFASLNAEMPARFFLISYPAHTAYPVTLIKQTKANRLELGKAETANRRVIYQYIHEKGAKSCQLVMGFTQMEPGSVWNTMPPHTHARRSEVYLYFDVPQDAAVIHLMGPGDETRHLVMQNEQAALSPIWSIHSGCGTFAYSFVWAMGGENQRFDDMDSIPVTALR
jgi:4-deoxy-L-threo-5-hexosulose-uronate ketol-isomerase